MFSENRQRIDTVFASMFVILMYGFIRERHVWSFYKPSQSHWERANPYWTDCMWIENLRMRKDTFNFVCNELRHSLIKKNTCFLRPISVEARVAMALWRLATGIDYCSVGQLFGVGRSKCCKITHEVCQAIVNGLLTRFIKIVTGERLEESKAKFLHKKWSPSMCGCC